LESRSRRGPARGRSRGPGGGPRRAGTARGPARPDDPSIEPLHPTADPPDIRSFREFDLPEELQQAIEAMGISVPTPIQRLAIQPVLDGRDVIAKAETGTGKTLAFGAPIVARLEATRSTVLALVLCPTRELAQQVCNVMAELGRARGLSTALIVGGEPMHDQIVALKAGAQIVVGTPGRVLDLYGQGFLSFPWTEFVVLDEADEMLEIGFLDDVKKILSFTPPERQTLHFSATFPHDVLALARHSTREPVELATARGVSTVETIQQSYIKVDDEDRPTALRRLVETSSPEDVFLVFCDRRTEVDRLMRVLERAPFSTKALHGGFDQASRFRVMSAFRTGEVKVLVATDVASRGLDVAHVTHVINFSVPQDIQDYTHRIGRTGRAGRAGTAITFVTRRTWSDWQALIGRAPWTVPESELPPARGHAGRDERPRRSASRLREAPDHVERPQEAPRRVERPREERPPRRERPPREERAPREERGPRRERPEPAQAQRAAPASRAPEVELGADGRPRRRETTRERLARERAEAEGRGAGSERRDQRPPERAARPEGDRPPRRERDDRPRPAERRGSSEHGGFGSGV
jgi:superfamily II DNA/RNA helicase